MSAITKLAKSDELKSSEVMFDNCWLGGSPAIRTDAVLFLEATKQLGAMLSSCRSSLKKLVEAQLLSDSDKEDGFEKGCALIRSNLGIDPTNGDYEEWAENYVQALWLEQWRLKNTADMLAKMIGGEQ